MTNFKVTDAQVLRAVGRSQAGRTTSAIAKTLGVSHGTAYRRLRQLQDEGHIWCEVTRPNAHGGATWRLTGIQPRSTTRPERPPKRPSTTGR